MFSSSGLRFLIIICYEKNYFLKKKKKSIILLKKAFENIILKFYELCKS